MKKAIRSYLFLPLAAILLVAIPAILFSVTGKTPTALAQTVPTPTFTVPTSPLPTATVPYYPPRPFPPPPIVTPADGRIRVGGYILEKVIGNRLSATIYGLTFNDRLYRTENDGRTWALITTAPDVDEFLMSPDDPDVLYSTYPLECSSNVVQALFRSEDGGLTWDDMAPPMSLLPLLADPNDADTLYAAGCDGIYLTTDGGASWAALSTAADEPLWETYFASEMELADGDALYVRADSAAGESVILYSADGGSTWSVISPDASDATLEITSITVDPDEDGRVWAADAQGVWSTEDLGQFWGLSSAGLASVLDDGLNDVILHSTEKLFLATNAGFYSKTVAATRWTKLGRETVALEIFNFLFTDSLPSRLWLNTENGVYRYLVR